MSGGCVRLCVESFLRIYEYIRNQTRSGSGYTEMNREIIHGLMRKNRHLKFWEVSAENEIDPRAVKERVKISG